MYMYLYNAFKTVIKKTLFLPCPYKTTPKTLKKKPPKNKRPGRSIILYNSEFHFGWNKIFETQLQNSRFF